MLTTGQGASPSSVRGWNEYAVVSTLREGPKRISDIASATRLTPAALGDVLRGLADKGWVDVSAPMNTGRGRPAQMYRLRQQQGCVVGLDVGAHTVRAVVLGLEGELLARHAGKVPTDDGTSPERERHRLVGEVVAAALEAAGTPRPWLTMLAVGGRIDVTGRVETSVALPDWEGHHPADMFADVLPSRALVVNDIRSATWAEHLVGTARGHDELLLVHLGRRPTLGLLVGGVPRRGAHGMAGDMSLSSLLPTEEHMDWLAPYGGPDPLGDGVRAALAGDEQALRGAVGYVTSITPALVFAVSVLDPAAVAIGGALAPLAAHYLPGLEQAFREQLHEPPVVLASSLDEYATAVGAGLLGLRRLVDTLSSPTAGVAPFTVTELEARLAAAEPSEVDQLQVVPSSGTVPSS